MKAYELENYKIVKETIRQDVFCVSIVNHFRASFNGKESDKHRDKKYERFVHWRKLGYNVVTEAILKSGLKPDLIIFDNNSIFIEEIVNTEGLKSIEKKRKDYPFKIYNVIEVNENGCKNYI